MNVLAEKPGQQHEARARRDASRASEYAGALMWNSGSDVMSRSSLVSCIQYGNPSPAMTYARCVCITSFDRPVVPDVGIITATSVSSTGAGPRPSGEAVEEVAQRRIVDDELRLDLLHESGELVVGARGVDRDLDRADLHQREPHEQVVGRVARDHQHAIAGADAGRPQPARGAVDPLLRARISEHAVVGVQPRLAGNCVDGGAHESRDGAGH